MFIGAVLCALALHQMLVSKAVTLHPDPFHFGIIFFCSIANLSLSALAWRFFLYAVSGCRIGLREAMSQVGLLLVGKYVPGKISGVAARIFANSPTIAARRVAFATALEQAGGMAAALLLGSLAFWGSGRIGVLMVISALAIISLWIVPPVLTVMVRRWSFFSLGDAPELGVSVLRRAFVVQTLQWAVLLLLVLSVASMVAPEMKMAVLLQIGGAYALAVIAGQLAFLFPGGIGPREGAFVWLLSGPVTPPQALAIALALRVATTAIDLLGGVGYLLKPKRVVSAVSERRAS